MIGISRRGFLGGISGLLLSPAFGGLRGPTSLFKGDRVLAGLLEQAKTEGWAELAIGDRVGKIAMALVGTPYVGHTLDIDDHDEICVVDLEGLDCVTLFEVSLDLARVLGRGRASKQALIDEVRYTRYRNGVQNGFLSRLHYTKEWIADNVRKGVVEDITKSLNGVEPFTQQVNIMSAHPEYYRQIMANPGWVPEVRLMENRVNRIQSWYLPVDRIAENEKLLHTGDIVGVTTSTPGIEIAHTGLCYRDEAGSLRFLDASSMASVMKVHLEGPLHEAVRWSRRNTGVVIVRPLPASR